MTTSPRPWLIAMRYGLWLACVTDGQVIVTGDSAMAASRPTERAARRMLAKARRRYGHSLDGATVQEAPMTTPATPPPTPPRTCGNCQHFIQSSACFPLYGQCLAPLPLICEWQGDTWTDSRRDATQCPCWKAKE